MLALALALNVAPVHLLVPPDDYEAPYPVAPKVTAPNYRVRGWIRGVFTLAWLPRVGDKREFFAEIPPDEFEEMQRGRCLVCGGRSAPSAWQAPPQGGRP